MTNDNILLPDLKPISEVTVKELIVTLERDHESVLTLARRYHETTPEHHCFLKEASAIAALIANLKDAANTYHLTEGATCDVYYFNM